VFPGYDKIGVNTHGNGPTKFEICLEDEKEKKINLRKAEK
jgi:hypothetical protein